MTLPILLLASAAWAQTNNHACDAPPELSAKLEKAATAAVSPELPFDARMAPFRDLVRRYPDDPFVNRLYLAHFAGYNLLPLYDRQLPQYDGPGYLHALSHLKRDPKASAGELEKLAAADPRSPWPRFTLAYIYGHIKPTDDAKAGSRLGEFAGLCPETLDHEVLERIAADGTAELKAATVERLRRQLPGRTDWLALEAWPTLWQLEFQITPAAGHDELRKRIGSDLARLRGLKSQTEDRRLRVLRAGYILVNDSEGRDWSRAELLRVAPQSAATAEAVIEDWRVQHPYPERSAPFASQIEFSYTQGGAAKDWIERWPDYGPAWNALFSAIRIEGLPADQVDALGRQLAAFTERDPDYTLGFTDTPLIAIAEQLAASGTDLALAQSLLDRAMAQAHERHASDTAAAVKPLNAEMVEADFQIVGWLGARVRAILLARTGKPDAAQAELKKMLQEIDRAPAGSQPYWRGIVAAAESAITADFHPIARDALTRMASALASEKPSREHSMHESNYWETRAKLAIAEGRGTDGVAYYLRAVSANPRDFAPAGRSRLVYLAHREWGRTGGTEDGWQAYSPDALNASSLPQWSAIGRPMPDFSLQDSSGHPVRLGDLHGKKVFVNVWATWCGPCQGELPWVERLYQALKDRKDVAVLTFNIDDNPGLIAPYMREHQLTFPVVLAEDYVNSAMKVEAIPRNWIIDGEGVLRYERSAGFDDTFVKDTMEAMGVTPRN